MLRLSSLFLTVLVSFVYVNHNRQLVLGHPSEDRYVRRLELTSAENATAAAVIYGYPILPWLDLVYPLLNTTGANALTNFPLATTNAAAIDRPNVDTVYSAVPIDLSQRDVELTIPSIPDGRFYVFPFYDLYGNNFASLGSVSDTRPGTYLLRPGNSSFGVELSNDGSRYQGYVNFPTTYGLIFPRIVIRNRTTDIATVNGYRRGIVLSSVPRKDKKSSQAPPLSQNLLKSTLNYTAVANRLPSNLTATDVHELLRLTALLTQWDPPENRSLIIPVTETLATAGIAHGTYNPPANINKTIVHLLVEEALLKSVNHSNFQKYGNDWVAPPPDAQGNFHTNYATRAYIAWSGYLELAPDEALYPEYIGPLSTNNQLSLQVNESLLFTFSGKPPVTGFWSMTAYGADNFLIPNPEAVYSLGDRSNLTYPDGSLIYGNSADRDRNGEFQILMQAGSVSPPANWTNNWLPAPDNGGLFSINLRWYGPTDAFQNGSYSGPIVTRQGVLKT